MTKESSPARGPLQPRVQVLDAGLRTVSDDYDILQSGSTVLVVDEADFDARARWIRRTVALGEPVDLPGGAKDGPRRADRWRCSTRPRGTPGVAPAQSAGSEGAGKRSPVRPRQGGGCRSRRRRDGVRASPPPAERSSSRAPTPRASRPSRSAAASRRLPRTRGGVDHGRWATRPVVLDADTGTCTSNGRRSPVNGRDGASAAVRGRRCRRSLPRRRGSVRRALRRLRSRTRWTPEAGIRAPPVFLDGCTYAVVERLGQVPPRLRGRRRRPRDRRRGHRAHARPALPREPRRHRAATTSSAAATWMAAEDLRRVDNWEEITPPRVNPKKTSATSEEHHRDDAARAPRRATRRRRRPTTTSASVPGRTTMLAVLDNDSDPDRRHPDRRA